ncbi:methyltransferase domain-containing protein [Streptomyces decoyicus]|uniref:methyltransferase domain-containing protein n=1 Tax=Streptomyces decoyicus TaxID=249567 RepID=UPI0033B58981
MTITHDSSTRAFELIAPEIRADLIAAVRENWPDLSDGLGERGVHQMVVFLATSAGTDAPMTPSLRVDLFWHAFVLHTKPYADFCTALGGFIHHVPDRASRNPAEARAAVIRTRSAISAAGYRADPEFWPGREHRRLFGGLLAVPRRVLRQPREHVASQPCEPGERRQPSGPAPGGRRADRRRTYMNDARVAAWDTYAQGRAQRRTTNARGESTWFNWTQYPDHGPGAEQLSLLPGGRVLDLGCGSGGNLAHLTTLGMRAVGVDVSPAQLGKARARWPGVGGMELHQGDALDFLVPAEPFDAIYSVFGAAYFTDPVLMLPAVHAVLRPGGVFAMSQQPAVEGCYGCQASYIPRGPDEDPAVVRRWDYPTAAWPGLLRGFGFVNCTATVLPAPARGRRKIGTLLIRAVREG